MIYKCFFVLLFCALHGLATSQLIISVVCLEVAYGGFKLTSVGTVINTALF
jgi:hypothetical protein